MRNFTAATPLPQFLPYPIFLLDTPIGETARLVYILILGRIRLSQQNGWVDEQNRVYCRYPIHAIAADAHKSKSTIVSALSELEKHDLLHRKRGGAGYANLLYLRLPETCATDCRKPAPQNARKPAPNKNNQSYYKAIDYSYKGDSL